MLKRLLFVAIFSFLAVYADSQANVPSAEDLIFGPEGVVAKINENDDKIIKLEFMREVVEEKYSRDFKKLLSSKYETARFVVSDAANRETGKKNVTVHEYDRRVASFDNSSGSPRRKPDDKDPISKYKKPKEKKSVFPFERYNYLVLGIVTFEGESYYRLRFYPKKNLKFDEIDDQVLNRLEGSLLVNVEDHLLWHLEEAVINKDVDTMLVDIFKKGFKIYAFQERINGAVVRSRGEARTYFSYRNPPLFITKTRCWDVVRVRYYNFKITTH